MSEHYIPLRCRLFGHRWQAHHKVEKTQPYGLLVWAYIEDVCKRCYSAQYLMPSGDSYQDTYPRASHER